MAKDKEISDNVWAESPQSGKNLVLQEFDDKNGVSQIDISTGYYTNEWPLNHKKYPDFDIVTYEKKMPDVIRELRFDDGESYWYPSTLQTENALLFPAIVAENTKWCYAPKKVVLMGNELNSKFESAVDMEMAEYFDNYLDAAKKVNGFSLGDI